MINYDKVISELNIEKLAELLISEVVENDGYYGYDGEDEYWIDNYTTMFKTYANDYLYDYYEDALKDTIEWLNEECINGNDIHKQE